MYEHSSTHPADTTPTDQTARTTRRRSPFRRTVWRGVLPTVAAAGIGVTGFAGLAHGSEVGSATTGGQSATATGISHDGSARAFRAAGNGSVRQAAAADFPTWGTRWAVHATADTGSPTVGMINKTAPGQDRITADYQVDTGRKVCEGSSCSTFMAHLTGPVSGFLSVVAVDIPQDRLPGVPVQGGGGQPQPQPGGSRAEMLNRAATWLTANNGAQVPYSQAKVWKDGYRQDCSGYVSMALGLPTPGTNTVGLATNRGITRPVSLGELKPGDLLIDASGDNNTRHVVIFEKWNNDAHSSYTAYEQRGDHGTDHRTLTYGLPGGDAEFKPYRPVKFGD
ncbi:hypothetical protein HEP86_20270 [Streptomyces sp. RPA4-5]|uniref:hypothetical protein n=1 Tax=unclassified Streptomyces TaxID=2593676 RepID=UPI00143E42D0|nr:MULTISPECIES: hypothetical protein [unclassified Streptomyces]QIY56435.1 hypothetical protein HEP86_20270 [Streptomyces sp. RPA4-5]WJY39320.1 hypothetical protein QT196_19680 [Streptomyces sp. P9-2B-2]